MELKENAVNALVWGPGNVYILTVCLKIAIMADRKFALLSHSIINEWLEWMNGEFNKL